MKPTGIIDIITSKILPIFHITIYKTPVPLNDIQSGRHSV